MPTLLAPAFENKICRLADLPLWLWVLPRPLVMTNGVFDILHRGHVTYLARARAQGASLVVAVNTDSSAKQLGKGKDRPINACADRCAVLAGLESVSLVVPFEEETAVNLVGSIHPDVYVKGGDYVMHAIPEGMAVQMYGGKVLAIPFEYDRSTSQLLTKIRTVHDKNK